VFVRTPEQQQLAELARDFCTSALGPTLGEDDEREHFRREVFDAMGEQGLLGLPTPTEYGGLGLGYVDYVVVLEEIARVSASYAVTVAVNGLPQVILRQFGTAEQRERWLPLLATGKALGAFALSEASSGSDAASLRCSAKKEHDGYHLTGTKLWITHGGVADLYVVMARTGVSGPKGVSAFLVPGDARGLRFGKKEQKMGLRASPTAEIVLDDVVVPESARIGDEGSGFTVAMTALDSGRITIGATAVGLSVAAMEYATKYASERKQFDTPIIDFQGVGFMLADMAVRTEAARLLVLQAAGLKDAGLPFGPVAAMAKVAATDAAMATTTDAVQVLGGNGYTREYPVERYMRDAKVMQIVEGTNQIQRLVISRHLRRTVGTFP
jgi:alkylation response protein AidB-like acyl-CoA dehydrogenase